MFWHTEPYLWISSEEACPSVLPRWKKLSFHVLTRQSMDAHSQNYGILAQNEKTVPKIHILFKIHNIIQTYVFMLSIAI
jgi:hypothetical protein